MVVAWAQFAPASSSTTWYSVPAGLPPLPQLAVSVVCPAKSAPAVGSAARVEAAPVCCHQGMPWLFAMAWVAQRYGVFARRPATANVVAPPVAGPWA